jgi:hypothetical protein
LRKHKASQENAGRHILNDRLARVLDRIELIVEKHGAAAAAAVVFVFVVFLVTAWPPFRRSNPGQELGLSTPETTPTEFQPLSRRHLGASK